MFLKALKTLKTIQILTHTQKNITHLRRPLQFVVKGLLEQRNLWLAAKGKPKGGQPSLMEESSTIWEQPPRRPFLMSSSKLPVRVAGPMERPPQNTSELIPYFGIRPIEISMIYFLIYMQI